MQPDAMTRVGEEKWLFGFFCAARPLRQNTMDKERSHEPEHELECERDDPEI